MTAPRACQHFSMPACRRVAAGSPAVVRILVVMARNGPNQPGRVPQSVYWRRRVAVLTVGFGVVACVAWLATGLLGGSGRADGTPAAAATSPAAGQAAAAGHHSAAADPRGTAGPRNTAGPRGTAGAHGSTGTAGQARAGGRAAAAGSGRVSATPPAGLPPACAPQDVVLSLTTSRGSYGPGAQPEFDVYVVSLATRDCSVNLSPAALSVVIKAGGTRRFWDSADCARGPGVGFAQLTRGVPYVLHFLWGRRGSSPGCRQAGPAAQLGTYTATVVLPAAHLASQGTVFVLAGNGTGMP